MKEKKLEIAGISAAPGQRARGVLPVVNGGESLPFTLLCGAYEGPVVLITAGIHNAEYVGIQAAMELADELEPDRLHGDVILLPLVNRNGFEHRTMSMVYDDGKNLNRVFPGRPDGTLSERIAWTITEELHKRVDYYIDLHGGDGYEELTPYVYCPGRADPEVVRKSKAMAMQIDVPYLIVSPFGSGGSYNHAAHLGVPSILLERGGMGRWTAEEVEADKKDVRNVFRHLGLLRDAPEDRTFLPADAGNVFYEAADHTGCWYPEKRVGDRIRKGELLGVIRDYTGQELQACVARQDGILLYQVASLAILQHGPMVAYSELPQDLTEDLNS